MKINQLFVKMVDVDMLCKLLACFELKGLHDMQMFSKNELVQRKTAEKMLALKPELQTYYLRCKAQIYLDNITLKKSITVLKQVLRLYDYYLVSHEKNINNKKVIFYQLVAAVDRHPPTNMKQDEREYVLCFS